MSYYFNHRRYRNLIGMLDLLQTAAADNPDRVQKIQAGIWAIDDDEGHKFLFVKDAEAHNTLLRDLGWELGLLESWGGDYIEPELIYQDEVQAREDAYTEYWAEILSGSWEFVNPNDLEVACVDTYRPVYTTDGIEYDEDGNEKRHTTCWGTEGTVLKQDAQFWTFDNFVYTTEIQELLSKGYVEYRIFTLEASED